MRYREPELTTPKSRHLAIPDCDITLSFLLLHSTSFHSVVICNL